MELPAPHRPQRRNAATQVLRGACLCGAIAFELHPSHQYGPGRAMGICHCAGCRSWSGGAGLPFVVVVPERFRVTRGQELMAHYRDERLGIRTFCRRCGSSLYQDTGTTYYVSAGVLDDLTLTPGFHIHLGDRPAWDQTAGDAPESVELHGNPPREA